MNKFFIALPLVAMLAACGTTRDAYERRSDAERERQEKYVERALDKSPEWMHKLPLSNSAVFESGTAVSADISMADHKAKADAYGKICMTAGGSASQRTKVFKMDTQNASTEVSEMALRTACQEVDLTGVEVREIKRIAEGPRFRTYVLVALPTGDANVLRKAREAQKLRELAEQRSVTAFKEMDKKE